MYLDRLIGTSSHLKVSKYVCMWIKFKIGQNTAQDAEKVSARWRRAQTPDIRRGECS